MIKFFIFNSLMILMFLFMSFNPLLMCLFLIFLSLSVSSLLAMQMSKWVMFAIILIFLGGMMVIFLYATTLSFSQKFFYTKNSFMQMWLYILVLMIFYLKFETFSSNSMSSLYWMFSALSFSQMLFLVSYLLLTLILTVKMVENFKGAMKSFH